MYTLVLKALVNGNEAFLRVKDLNDFVHAGLSASVCVYSFDAEGNEFGFLTAKCNLRNIEIAEVNYRPSPEDNEDF